MVGPTHLSITQETPEPEHIILRFEKHRLPYFKSKPIHPFWDEYDEKGKEDLVFCVLILNSMLTVFRNEIS